MNSDYVRRDRFIEDEGFVNSDVSGTNTPNANVSPKIP
jgi:hypothetical protein